METKEITKEELLQKLDKEVRTWVERTFNYIKLEVVEKMADGELHDYIRQPSIEETMLDWFSEQDDIELITEFFISMEEEGFDIEAYQEYDSTMQECFIKVFGKDKWDEFTSWLCEVYSDDIQEYIYEQENYPVWNTLFEFREDLYNQESDVEKCLASGLGVIEGLEPFNNMVFMTSCGHSFFASYWIPLYLSLYTFAQEKYDGITYADYQYL